MVSLSCFPFLCSPKQQQHHQNNNIDGEDDVNAIITLPKELCSQNTFCPRRLSFFHKAEKIKYQLRRVCYRMLVIFNLESDFRQAWFDSLVRQVSKYIGVLRPVNQCGYDYQGECGKSC